MRDTLENLYFGNITPNDQIVKSGTALKKAMEQSAECEEKLTALLDHKYAQVQKAFKYFAYGALAVSYTHLTLGQNQHIFTVAVFHRSFDWDRIRHAAVQIFFPIYFHNVRAVSYTHLDVYKRQVCNSLFTLFA